MRITIESIDHDKQRYPTCGDYFIYPNGEIVIKVSKCQDKRYEYLVALHEMIEVILTQERGISEESITEFDVKFESQRPEGNVDEPGDDSSAPYKKEHFFATNLERLFAEQLGVDWKTYDDFINSL